MSLKLLLCAAAIALGICSTLCAGVKHTTVCSIEENSKKFLNAKVEVNALILAGIEYPSLKEGRCSFPYERGDDYQTLGNRFPIEHDSQWSLMRELLGTTNCASNVRVVRARIKGTVIRAPARGTIPANEMPLELVIQSVSEVSRVPISCTPPESPLTK
jgi:hypothetical protein